MAVAKITDDKIGKFLKIVSRGAVYDNLSEDSTAWEMIKRKKVDNAVGREVRGNLRTGRGASAVGFVPLDGGAFLASHKSTIQESITVFKDYVATIEVPQTLINKALSDPDSYGRPLAEEIRDKTVALSRMLSYSLFGDGTGVMATHGSDALSSGKVLMTLSALATARGSITWAEESDKWVAATEAGVDVNPTVAAGTFSHYSVVDSDRDTKIVTLEARAADDSVLTVTASNLTAGDVFYRKPQKDRGTISDLTAAGIAAGTTDYNTLSESWVGLRSIVQNDGRLVNGINLSGTTAGTILDLNGANLDSHHFQRIMSKLRIKVGKKRYKYDRPLMSYEALDALVEAREVDRRFQSVTDSKRGVQGLGYVAGNDTLVFESDEFVPLDEIYICPEGDALQFFGADFDWVNPNGNGQIFFQKPNGSSYDRAQQAFMEGSGALNCVHYSSIGCIKNFTTTT